MDTSPAPPSLGVGDPIRSDARVALLSVAAVAIAFEVFAGVSTQVRSVRAQSPWGNDPYDAVVSFTMFFVPLLVALGVARVQLCRRHLPLPVARVLGLMRASDAVSLVVGATVVIDWIGLAVRADRSDWGARTALLVAGLALVTALLGNATWRTRRVVTSLPGHFDGHVEDGDWMTDLLPLAVFLVGRRPRIGRPLVPLAEWIGARAVDGPHGVRRRPLASVAVGSIGAGLVIVGAQALRDEGLSRLFPLEVVIAAAGFFAFAVLANRGLHVVDVRPTDSPVGRAAWVAATLAALAMPVSLACRDLIWRGLGLGSHVGTLRQLTAVVSFSCAVVLVLSFVGAVLLAGDTDAGPPFT